MGKNRKGKECGKGICQRKDGSYCARFVDKQGKRHEKYFATVPEARNWLEEARYADKHQAALIPSDLTVDEWFTFWIENIVGDLAPNTRRNYRERYRHNIQPLLGGLKLAEVKPLHCKLVLSRMEADYAGSTIRQAYITMGTMLRSAVMNDLIARHPMDGVRYTKPIRAVDDIKYLTVEEQQKFLTVAKRSHNYCQYALILETGLRTGELIGLTWDAVDLEKRTLTVNKTLEYRYKQGVWRAEPPKTPHGAEGQHSDARPRFHQLANRRTGEKQLLRHPPVQAVRRSRHQTVLYARPAPHLRHPRHRKRHAAQGAAKAAGPRQHPDHHGLLRPCDG